jgi:hypothetical protein
MQELEHILIKRLWHDGTTGVIGDCTGAAVHPPDGKGEEGFQVTWGVEDEDDVLGGFAHGAVLEGREGKRYVSAVAFFFH